jgi:hypothetical protein
MMGNTYATVIEKSEKEFLKQVSRTDLWDERVAQELRHSSPEVRASWLPRPTAKRRNSKTG